MPSKKKKHTRPFVMIENETWQSKAWKELNGAAVKVYTVFKHKDFSSYKPNMHAPFKISYREIKQLTGLSPQSIRRAIIQLENLGFTDFVEQGGLKSAGYGKNSYKLSVRYLKYGMVIFEKGELNLAQNVHDRGFGLHKKWRHPRKPTEAYPHQHSEAKACGELPSYRPIVVPVKTNKRTRKDTNTLTHNKTKSAAGKKAPIHMENS
jgi:hypothetical protein